MTKEVSSAERTQAIESMCIDGLKHEKNELKKERESIYKSTIEVLKDSNKMAHEAIRETSVSLKELKEDMISENNKMKGIIESLNNGTITIQEASSQSAFYKIMEGLKEFCLKIKIFLFG